MSDFKLSGFYII